MQSEKENREIGFQRPEGEVQVVQNTCTWIPRKKRGGKK